MVTKMQCCSTSCMPSLSHDEASTRNFCGTHDRIRHARFLICSRRALRTRVGRLLLTVQVHIGRSRSKQDQAQTGPYNADQSLVLPSCSLACLTYSINPCMSACIVIFAVLQIL